MNKSLDSIKLLIAVCAVLAWMQGSVFSQASPVPPRPSHRAPVAKPEPPARPAPGSPVMPPTEGGDYERAIDVDPKVSVTLCVLMGSVKINGTAGEEVRVFVRDGSNIKFNIREKNPDSGKPVWIALTGVMPEVPKGPKGSKDPPNPTSTSNCLWGGDIEIDMPSGAALTLDGQETATTIDSVRKALVKNAGGNMVFSNVAEGIEARTFEGSLTVRESRGSMKLETSTGNIIVFGVNPGESGDVLRTKTSSGNIFLQMIGHRQVEANSVSGGVTFAGKLLSGGLYNFATSNGSLNLNLPSDSSARVNATYGFGQCNVELPMEDVVQTTTGRLKSMSGVIGTGEATLKLTTTSGSIRLKKSNKK